MKKEKIDLYWKAREFKPIKRSKDWYWFFWISILLLIAALYFIYNDTNLSILIFLIASVSTYLSVKKPSIIQYGINDEGVLLNNKKNIIPFETIKEYNIDVKKGYIYINTKKEYERLFEIPFEKNHNIKIIDKTLSKKIKKNKELTPPYLEILLRKILNF